MLKLKGIGHQSKLDHKAEDSNFSRVFCKRIVLLKTFIFCSLETFAASIPVKINGFFYEELNNFFLP